MLYTIYLLTIKLYILITVRSFMRYIIVLHFFWYLFVVKIMVLDFRLSIQLVLRHV